MTARLLIPLIFALAGCPTPPEQGPGGPGGGPAGGAAGGPGGGPNAGGAPGANGPAGSPPAGGENGPGGAPPEGGGAPGGEGAPGAGGPGAGGPGAGGPGAGGPGAGEAGAAGAGGPGAGGGENGPPGTGGQPNPGGGGPQSGSILVTVMEDGPGGGGEPQDKIKSGSYVTFSGSVECGGCTEPLIMSVLPFVDPEAGGDPGGPLAVISLSGEGNFEIAVPEGTSPVVMEVLADANKDSKPTKGERFAVLERAGTLKPSADIGGLKIDVTDRPIDPAAGGPLPPDERGGEPPPEDGKTGQ